MTDSLDHILKVGDPVEFIKQDEVKFGYIDNIYSTSSGTEKATIKELNTDKLYKIVSKNIFLLKITKK